MYTDSLRIRNDTIDPQAPPTGGAVHPPAPPVKPLGPHDWKLPGSGKHATNK